MFVHHVFFLFIYQQVYVQTADELMYLSKISQRVASSVVKVYFKCCQFAQCFYAFKANIETNALQGPDSRKL